MRGLFNGICGDRWDWVGWIGWLSLVIGILRAPSVLVIILMVVFVFHQVIVQSDDGKSRVFCPDAFE